MVLRGEAVTRVGRLGVGIRVVEGKHGRQWAMLGKKRELVWLCMKDSCELQLSSTIP